MDLSNTMSPVRDLGGSLESLGESLGIRRASEPHYEVLGGLALFAAGVALGFGLGVLFAPAAGREMRENISEQISQKLESVRDSGHVGEGES